MLIVFDLDDTLIDTSGSVTPFKLRQFLELLQKRGVSFDSMDRAIQEIISLNRVSLSSKEVICQTLMRYGVSHWLPEALAQQSEPLPDDFVIPTTPHAKKVLSQLKERGYRLAIVTGGVPAFQLEKLKKAGLEPSIFSKIDIPEDSKKKLYYEGLLREFSVLPANCFVVGDRVPMDLVPAHELGCRTIHMRWGRGLIWKREQWIDRSISDLSELLEIL